MSLTDKDPLPFESGGLPDGARRRVEEAALRKDGFFTSTFSVPAMAVARLAGYEPIAQVMGSSMYHVGWSNYIGYAGGELETVSHAMREARRLSLSRMAEEARILGADAVIGVELSVRGYEWSGELSEFTAIGTAVRLARGEEGRETAGRTEGALPVLSNLNVQDLYKLELSGLWPAGIVMGNCTWYDRHADCTSDGSWNNQELPNHTACIDSARRLATQRFKEDVREHAALGAVGVQVLRHFHERHWEQNHGEHTSFKAELFLIGTAVVRRAPSHLPRPRLVLDLGDRKIDLNAIDPTAAASHSSSAAHGAASKAEFKKD